MSENLPQGWAIASLSSLISHDGIMVDGDWVESKDQDPNGNVRLIQLADVGSGTFVDKSNRWLTSERAAKLNCTTLKTGDLLISRLGEPLGKACIFPIVESECVTVVDVHIFRSGTPLVSHRWLMHALNSYSVRALVESQSSGTTRKRITGQKLKDLQLPIPPSSEQQRIASRLDELFSCIDEGERALERVRKLAERYRQSVLKAAMTGELTRDWRQQYAGELGSGEALLTRILEARCKAWEKSELGRMNTKGSPPANHEWKKKYREPSWPDVSDLPELPTGWIWSSLGQLFKVTGGSTPSRKEPSYWGGEIPWVSSGEVAFCRISETAEHITEDGFRHSSVRLHPAGTLLLAMIGEGKTRGQAAILDIPACHNQNAASIGVSATPIPPEYVYYFLKFQYEKTRAIGQGGNQPALNGEIVKAMPIPLPPLKEIVAICERLAVQLEYASQIEASLQPQLALITAQRQSILREAFAGRLVPQDISDEPAAVLLERISAARCASPKLTATEQGRRKKVNA